MAHYKWAFLSKLCFSLLLNYMYYKTIIYQFFSHWLRLEVVLGWIIHVVKFFSKESTYKVSVAELEKMSR